MSCVCVLIRTHAYRHAYTHTYAHDALQGNRSIVRSVTGQVNQSSNPSVVYKLFAREGKIDPRCNQREMDPG